MTSPQKRVMLLGATGTIGRAVARELVARGHKLVCVTRSTLAIDGADVRTGDVTDPASLAHDGFRGEPFDAVVSCLASRTGVPKDAWAIDHRAQANVLAAAKLAGVAHFVLLSAICVQRPKLAFQHAKLAFEAELQAAGLDWTIVRPTAFFKSLSGQIARVQSGKPFLVFGDGTLTACQPISDRDLAAFIADCLDNPAQRNRILPIGGPGPAITPRDQGEALFAMLEREAKFRQVPVVMLDAIIAVLGALGRLSPALAAKAELARIGRYYATESMLILDPATGRYDPEATPSFGRDTLFDHYRQIIAGKATDERGDHAVF